MRLPVSTIQFPFQIGKAYTLRELVQFETALSAARKDDAQLSDHLRAPQGHDWVSKPRNIELLPLLYYTRHLAISEESKFELTPEESSADIILRISDAIERLQITTAFPQWPRTMPGRTIEGGQFDRRAMERLNKSGEDDLEYEGDQGRTACQCGLVMALQKKLKKNYSESGSIALLVFGKAFDEVLSLTEFRECVTSAWNEISRHLDASLSDKFARICVFTRKGRVGEGDGYFIELTRSASID
jgi:hypothetical protein